MKKIYVGVGLVLTSLLFACGGVKSEQFTDSKGKATSEDVNSILTDTPSFTNIPGEAVIIFPSLISATDLNRIGKSTKLIAVRMYLEGGVGSIGLKSSEVKDLTSETSETLKFLAQSVEKRNQKQRLSSSSKCRRGIY